MTHEELSEYFTYMTLDTEKQEIKDLYDSVTANMSEVDKADLDELIYAIACQCWDH